MDTIENPKIDRLNRLGEVSLTVRTGRGEKGGRGGGGQFAAGPSSLCHPGRPHLLLPVSRPPSAGTGRMQRAVTGRVQGELVGYVVCKPLPPCASMHGSDCSARAKRGSAAASQNRGEEHGIPQTSCVAVVQKADGLQQPCARLTTAHGGSCDARHGPGSQLVGSVAPVLAGTLCTSSSSSASSPGSSAAAAPVGAQLVRVPPWSAQPLGTLCGPLHPRAAPQLGDKAPADPAGGWHPGDSTTGTRAARSRALAACWHKMSWGQAPSAAQLQSPQAWPGGLSKGRADQQHLTSQNAGAYLSNTRFLVASIPNSTRAPRSCRK